MTHQKAPEEEDLSPEVTAQYKDLEKLAVSGQDPASTRKKIELFLQKHPEPSWQARGWNLKGLMAHEEKDYKAASNYFKKALSLSQSSLLSSLIRISLGGTQLQQRQYHRAMKTLGEVKPQILDINNRTKFHLLRLRASLNTQNIPQAAESYAFLSNQENQSITRALRNQEDEIKSKFETALSLREQIQVAPLFQNTPLGPSTSLYVGRRLVDNRRLDLASRFLRSTISQDPEGSEADVARGLLNQIRNPDILKEDPLVICAILPLSGRMSRFGEKALQGLSLSLDLFGKEHGYRLVMGNSHGGDPVKAANSLEQTVKDHGCIAVVGGLISRGAEAQARKARSLRVPFISLSQKDVSKAGQPWGFQLGMTQEHQVENLLRYVDENLQVKRLALMHSQKNWAKDFANLFWKESKRRNLFVKAYKQYELPKTDFRDDVQRLVGLDQTQSRSLEKRARKKFVETLEKKEPAEGRQERLKRKRLEKLPPDIRFEAIFIPELPKAAAQIIPTFAYEDVNNVRFLGISAWNTSVFLDRTKDYSENTLIPAGFHEEDPRSAVVQFVGAYRSRHQAKPDFIAAQAYDAGRLLWDTLRRNQVETHEELQRNLRQDRWFHGVSGSLKFDQARSQKRIYILMVKNGSVRAVSSPQKGFRN